MILAAGKGERLKPITETRPKPLIPILGESLLCRHIRLGSRFYNPDEIVVIASYMIDRVKEHLARCEPRARIVDQGGEKGTGHAIYEAMKNSNAEEFLIVYSDLFITHGVYEIMSRVEAPSILAVRVDNPSEFGVLEIQGGYLKRIIEKPPPGKEPSNLIFAGVIKLSHEHAPFFESLTVSPRGEFEATDALSEIALVQDVQVVVKPEGEKWLDVGRPWEVLDANKLALDEVSTSIIDGEIHDSAVIEGPVIVEEGAYIAPHSLIRGPAYIGPNATVGPHAYVRPYTVMLTGSKAGHSTEVKASILMEHAKAPHLNYIGDSIIGEHVNLGAGTITANLRFDHGVIKMTVKGRRISTGRKKLGAVIGGYAQTGINVSILPGVKIGSYALVYPGCIVTRDVERGGVVRCGTLG